MRQNLKGAIKATIGIVSFTILVSTFLIFSGLIPISAIAQTTNVNGNVILDSGKSDISLQNSISDGVITFQNGIDTISIVLDSINITDIDSQDVSKVPSSYYNVQIQEHDSKNVKYSHSFLLDNPSDFEGGAIFDITSSSTIFFNSLENSTSVWIDSGTLSISFNDYIEGGFSIKFIQDVENPNNAQIYVYKKFGSGQNDILLDPIVSSDVGSGAYALRNTGWNIFNESGRIWVVYGNESESKIYYTSSTDDGITWGTSTEVMSNVVRGSTTYDNMGQAIVVAARDSSNPEKIHLRNISSDGSLGTEYNSSDRDAGNGAVCTRVGSDYLCGAGEVNTGTTRVSAYRFVSSWTNLFTNTTYSEGVAGVFSNNDTNGYVFLTSHISHGSDQARSLSGRTYQVGGTLGAYELIDPSTYDVLPIVGQSNGTMHILYHDVETSNLKHRIRNSGWGNEITVFNFSIGIKNSDPASVNNVSISWDSINETLYAFWMNSTGIYAKNWTSSDGWGSTSKVFSFSGNPNVWNLHTSYNVSRNNTHVYTHAIYQEGTQILYNRLDLSQFTNESTLFVDNNVTISILGGGLYGDTSNTAQQYLAFFGDSRATTEYDRQKIHVPTNGTIRNLYANKEPGGSDVTFALYKNGSSTSLTCDMVSGATFCSDISNSINVTAGDTIAMGIDLDTATPTGYFRFAVELVTEN